MVNLAMAQLQLRSIQMARLYRTGGFMTARITLHNRAASRYYGTEIEPAKPQIQRMAKETKSGRTFQGLVMSSIGARLRREAELREEYEKWRILTDPARNWSITFGT